MGNLKIESLSGQVEALNVSLTGALESIVMIEDGADRASTASDTAVISAEAVSRAVSGIGDDLESIGGRSSETLEKVDADMDKIKSVVDTAGDDVSKVLDSILKTAADAFNDLRDAVKESKNQFELELNLQLDLIELGVKRIDELNSSFKNAVINGKTLRELLQGLDMKKFQDAIQELIIAMTKGKATIGDVLEFLNSRGGDFGKTVAGWVDQFQRSEITLGRLRDLIDNLVQQIGAEGSDFDDLLESLEELLEQSGASS